MKKPQVALYDPYLDTMGGGERHVLSILHVLEHERGFTPVIFWDQDLTEAIRDRLGLTFTKLEFRPDLFRGGATILEKIRSLKEFDSFIYVPDGSYFFSGARQNTVFCMVPDRKLYPASVTDRIKTANYRFIANSGFTSSWLARWGFRSTVLYPYLPEELISLSKTQPHKEKMILTVGRFFRHLHSKRQDIAIRSFRKLREKPEFSGYRFIMAGSVLPGDQDFLDELRTIAGNDPAIEFKVSISFPELLKLYEQAEYYWHYAGYGVDAEVNPQNTEHLGISPLEAMAAGCITCCYAAGGPTELIVNGKNGFLFTSHEELHREMLSLSDNRKHEIAEYARRFVRERFSYQHFAREVIHQFAPAT
ncbi:MAG: glycosyltransferase family 4 protein [Patescibacteria group bacterium]|nr:glycosyltransferase family 4 protein [Patescibacteria group bacterium]